MSFTQLLTYKFTSQLDWFYLSPRQREPEGEGREADEEVPAVRGHLHAPRELQEAHDRHPLGRAQAVRLPRVRHGLQAQEQPQASREGQYNNMMA